MIFNSERWKDDEASEMDRPFAGYLFAEKGYNYFYRNSDLLQWNISAGVLGPSAGGKQVQNTYHRLMNLNRVHGWNYQLHDDLAFNGSVDYHKNILKTGPRRRSVQLHLTGNARIGTIFTNASAGALLKIGMLDHPWISSYYHARIGPSDTSMRKAEFYFFIHPAIRYQVYDATIQGGIFAGDKGPFISSLNDWVYSHQWGIVFAQGRWTAQLSMTFETKEATTMRGQERYGAVALAYRYGSQ